MGANIQTTHAFYRLNPHLNTRARASSMFDLAKATDSKLIQGERWGDDYLVVELADGKAELVESMMREEGLFFERLDRLPGQHEWQMI